MLVDWVFKLLLYTEAGTRTNCSMLRQMVNDRKVNKNFHELYTFLGCLKMSSLLSICSVQRKQTIVVLQFCLVMSFYALQVCSQQTYYAYAEKPDKLFWEGLKEKIF